MVFGCGKLGVIRSEVEALLNAITKRGWKQDEQASVDPRGPSPATRHAAWQPPEL